MLKEWGRCLLFFVILTVIVGLIYPLLVTGLAQLVFPRQANGSLVAVKGRVVGSLLIGQEFSSPFYFHGRPSATAYDGMHSRGPNYAPSSRILAAEIEKRYRALVRENPACSRQEVPLDLITASASGLDPHISPEAALYQVRRVARARGISEERLRLLVKRYVRHPAGGVLGNPYVNVLELNLALDATFGSPHAINRDKVKVYGP
ncbi:potassium-transporting ATPase subunit KdpC [Thermodesulfitimonas autotrophica]|uniref:potassium-transporting ATPase subunit KdpC n=1 Tax=Thermodesulfitimonas autotrophica TaxID=1894989 RepID=UPI002FE094C1